MPSLPFPAQAGHGEEEEFAGLMPLRAAVEQLTCSRHSNLHSPSIEIPWHLSSQVEVIDAHSIRIQADSSSQQRDNKAKRWACATAAADSERSSGVGTNFTPDHGVILSRLLIKVHMGKAKIRRSGAAQSEPPIRHAMTAS